MSPSVRWWSTARRCAAHAPPQFLRELHLLRLRSQEDSQAAPQLRSQLPSPLPPVGGKKHVRRSLTSNETVCIGRFIVLLNGEVIADLAPSQIAG